MGGSPSNDDTGGANIPTSREEYEEAVGGYTPDTSNNNYSTSSSLGADDDLYAGGFVGDDFDYSDTAGYSTPGSSYSDDSAYEEGDDLVGDNIGMGYDIGWSVFDFFMKTHPQAMKFLGAVVNDRAVLSARGRGNGRLEAAFEQAINRNWQGGTALLEKGWHSWIKIKAAEAEKELLKARQKQR